ncbi:MAG: hypothetical protein ACRCWO_12970 [Bosea sp. (in: a-proteobacteria)]
MTEITRFPHYHQAENVVTNHVMVMFRLIYENSPKLLERLLQSLCENEIAVGPRFSQQIAGAHSVPDGLIQQSSFAVFIETKLGTSFRNDQLLRHCQSIVERTTRETRNYLIALGAGSTKTIIPVDVANFAREHSINIISLTFTDLYNEIEGIKTVDIALEETIREFIEFLFAQNLISRDGQMLVAVLSGTTWRENVTHGVFFDPAERSAKWSRAAFLGLYHNRQVSHVGRIMTSVVVSENANGELEFERPEKGILTLEQQHSIRKMIDASQQHYPGFQKQRHRFYVVDQFCSTDFQKMTPGGMMGHRYFDMQEISGSELGKNTQGVDAARTLSGHSFN